MSGSSGYDYSVVSAEELRRREDEERKGRCEQHMLKISNLYTHLEAFGVQDFERIKRPASFSHETLIQWERELIVEIESIEKQIREEAARDIMRRFYASKEAVDVTNVSLGNRSKSLLIAYSVENRNEIDADVDKVVKELVNLKDPAIRDELTNQVMHILNIKSIAQAKGDLSTLKTRMYNALNAQEYQGLADQAILDIAHIKTQEADLLRRDAGKINSMTSFKVLKQKIDKLLESKQKEDNAVYVQRALEGILKERYDTGEGFTQNVAGAVIYAAHRDYPNHGLCFQINPTNKMIFTRVVSYGDTTAEDDARVESETCAEVNETIKYLSEKGVQTVLLSQQPAGKFHVEKVQKTSAPPTDKQIITASTAKGAKVAKNRKRQKSIERSK